MLTIIDKSTDKALAGAAVYLWYCDIAGRYSMYSQGITYSQGVTNESYLGGVQENDSIDQVTFKSIFPAAYSGRWPHIHLEVFASLAVATNGKNKKATSQLVLTGGRLQARVCRSRLRGQSEKYEQDHVEERQPPQLRIARRGSWPLIR